MQLHVFHLHATFSCSVNTDTKEVLGGEWGAGGGGVVAGGVGGGNFECEFLWFSVMLAPASTLYQ